MGGAFSRFRSLYPTYQAVEETSDSERDGFRGWVEYELLCRKDRELCNATSSGLRLLFDEGAQKYCWVAGSMAESCGNARFFSHHAYNGMLEIEADCMWSLGEIESSEDFHNTVWEIEEKPGFFTIAAEPFVQHCLTSSNDGINNLMRVFYRSDKIQRNIVKDGFLNAASLRVFQRKWKGGNASGSSDKVAGAVVTLYSIVDCPLQLLQLTEEVCHLVPKSESHPTQWRISFSKVEMLYTGLYQRGCGNRCLMYMAFKSALYKHVAPITYLHPRTGEEKQFGSFLAKTTMMWLCEETGILRNFFIPAINLLADVPREACLEAAGRLPDVPPNPAYVTQEIDNLVPKVVSIGRCLRGKVRLSYDELGEIIESLMTIGAKMLFKKPCILIQQIHSILAATVHCFAYAVAD